MSILAVAANAMGPLTDSISEMLLIPGKVAEPQSRIRLLELCVEFVEHMQAQLNEVLQQVFRMTFQRQIYRC